MRCNGTTYVGHVEDDLGEIAYAFCDRCRTIAVDGWDRRRRRTSWGITYLDPRFLDAEAGLRPSRRTPGRLPLLPRRSQLRFGFRCRPGR